jgi:hypothetical protein
MTNTVPRLIHTTRALRAGVVALRLSVPCGPVEIVADNTATYATVAFEGSTPETCEMIGKVEVDYTDDSFSVRLPVLPSGASLVSLHDADSSTTTIDGAPIDLRTVVRIPPNSSVTVRNVIGNIAVQGPLLELKAITASGAIQANRVPPSICAPPPVTSLPTPSPRPASSPSPAT